MPCCRYPAKATLRKIRADIVELSFPKSSGFQFAPGQFVRIAIPDVTLFQFHPFSISSAPQDDVVTLHIRTLGGWTERLLKYAEDHSECKVLIEGPYGSVGVDIDNPRYGMVLCVSGGIGVTHCRSVARSLVYDCCQRGRKLEKLRFVWAVRDHDMLDDLPPFASMSNLAPVEQPMVVKPTKEVSIEINKESESSDSVEVTSDDSSSSSSSHGSDTMPITLPEFVQTEVYVTSTSNKQGVVDEETGHGTRNDQHHDHQHLVVHEGRPDLHKILKDMKQEALERGITHIAVFGCGPQSQVIALQEACRAHSKTVTECTGVSFDAHVEVFEF